MGGDADTVPVTVVVAPGVTPVHHPVARPPSHLPFTGAPVDALTAIALVVAVLGGGLVASVRRRTANIPETGATR